MGTSEISQRLSEFIASSRDWGGGPVEKQASSTQFAVRKWIVLDAVTVLCSAILATLLELHFGFLVSAMEFSHRAFIDDPTIWMFLGLLCGFTFALIVTSWHLHLYSPVHLTSIRVEQGLSVTACFISCLLLTGALYVIHADEIPRSVVLITVGLIAFSLSLRRLLYRVLLYNRYDRGIGRRNVLIVGTGQRAQTLRHSLESLRHLGYSFKGFINLSTSSPQIVDGSSEVVSAIEKLFQHAQREFADEIFFTAPCDREFLHELLEQSRIQRVDLRLVPDTSEELTWNWNQIEYIGKIPTVSLRHRHSLKAGPLFKRSFDMVFSGLMLIGLSLPLLIIAIAVKLDSPGPVLYTSERVGKKGRIFRCFKFRTMMRDAEKYLDNVMHMNERDGVLFKISNDPRVTKLGRFLRKYSLDELPQFFNVLRGDMSIVGPRPPLPEEVEKYSTDDLRRLDVTPGITGLWQVQGRQNPSFASYVSLDLNYIDNWNIWLDFKIILLTVGVVFAGTGT